MFPTFLIKGVGFLILRAPLLVLPSLNSLTCSPNLGSNSLSKSFWKIKAPSIVKALIWTAILHRINTNDLLQTRRPNKDLSPDVCMKF